MSFLGDISAVDPAIDDDGEDQDPNVCRFSVKCRTLPVVTLGRGPFQNRNRTLMG